jgi:hypothetical protein
MLGSTDLFSSSVGHGLINLPLADVRNQRYPAILRDVPPSLRDAAIPHHCPATSAAHRARLVLTSTRVIGRNAQIPVIARGRAEWVKSTLATIPKQSSGGSDWFAGDVHRTLWCFRRWDLLRMALCGGRCCQASGSNLTFESALGLLLGQRQDKAGHAAIRTVKQWVVLPIADVPERLHHLVCRNALAHSKSVKCLIRPARPWSAARSSVRRL